MGAAARIENGTELSIVVADITTLALDAIVNAANSSLLGGGGVDGAIHRKAGPRLAEECRMLHGCKTGEAKITAGYNLPARHIIHTVGPVWQGGDKGEPALLERCYRNSIALAARHNLRSLAFPAISTGIYRFPAALAARIAVETTRRAVADRPIDSVVFCCFDAASAGHYDAAFAETN